MLKYGQKCEDWPEMGIYHELKFNHKIMLTPKKEETDNHLHRKVQTEEECYCLLLINQINVNERLGFTCSEVYLWHFLLCPVLYFQ